MITDFGFGLNELIYIQKIIKEYLQATKKQAEIIDVLFDKLKNVVKCFISLKLILINLKKWSY